MRKACLINFTIEEHSLVKVQNATETENPANIIVGIIMQTYQARNVLNAMRESEGKNNRKPLSYPFYPRLIYKKPLGWFRNAYTIRAHNRVKTVTYEYGITET